ncbi:exonuclease domain-containing protein [Ornithinimicrobium murale]|uniref:exonuclease domain-containing protein n=1 Tax=Ornithinimicrobium murale TaxID=1050153 RepID=UPI000E0E0117|nr:exonuclease domain-containing protein [Ornithinimicrobium murale]
MPGINAAVVDFETANPHHASLLSVGAARVVDGTIIRKYHQLVRPTAPYDAFYRRNVDIHGIRPEHVIDAPDWADVAPGVLRSLLSGGPIVAHGAMSADLSMLNQALTAAGLAMPTVPYVCTQAMARQLLPGLPSYRLPDLVQHTLGRTMVGHHDAGEDAAATAEVLIAMCTMAGVDDLTPFVKYRRPKNTPLAPPKTNRWAMLAPVPIG